MSKLSIFLIFVLGLSVIAEAQSGRKSKSATTPDSTPSVEQTQNSGDYSESAPSKTSLIYTKPSSGGKKNKSKNKAEAPLKNPPSPETQTDSPTSGDDEEEVIKVGTTLVTIPVSVYERSGIYISTLRRNDFKIFENGVEQEVAYFGASEQQPFSVVLLIDTSPSTAYKITEIQNAAISFVNQLKSADRVMVIEFDASVNVLAELTNDREKIYKAIRRANFGNGTSLYEAVNFSLRKQLNKIEGRKAMVLFTDGVDTTSRGSSFDKTLSAAVESEAVIFPIYYNTFLASRGIGQGGVMGSPPILGLPTGGGTQLPSSADYARGKTYLEGLADLTGGRVFRPESTPGGLIAAFEGIGEELRSQYSIGYYPKEEGAAGERKQIKVRVNRPNVTVRARDSYIVGDNELSQKQ